MKKGAVQLLIPEARLEPLLPEAERLADAADMSVTGCRDRRYYHALIYYVMFTHLLPEMRERLGGIDDVAVLANAYYWYSVVFEFSHRIEPGSNPLEGEMDHVEGSPSHYFAEEDYIALIHESEEYVTRLRRRRGKTQRSGNPARRRGRQP